MMKKSTYLSLAILTFLFAFKSNSVKAQIFFNNGAEVYVTTGCVVQINGGMQDDNLAGPFGVMDNEGDIWVTSKGVTPGNIWISNTAVLQGNGKYHLDSNWINDASFICGNSTVDMYGNHQELITSNNATVTTFDTLMLRGAGVGANRRKQQTLDAIVSSALILNDRVLFTAGHTMFITTPTVSAVTNTAVYPNEGFVSSIGAGSLSRVTNSASAYFFPVGADSITLRYRKVILTPVAANANTYTARLANNNATADGLNTSQVDTTICTVNPNFYHIITHPVGTDNANIDVFYDQTADGIWSGLAQWNSPTALLWNTMGAVTYTPVFPRYSDVLKANWANFSNDPDFILSNTKPSAPILTCNPFCAGTAGVFTAKADSGGYIWTVPGGDVITGQGTDSITVTGSATGPITVTNSLTGCSSLAASCVLDILPAPTAFFDTSSSGIFHTTWAFVDMSKSGITDWVWTFGDGTGSTMPDPGHDYNGAGTYIVTETVTDSSGCKATKIDTIRILEGIIVPNVFTPNGDGINDVFLISTSGVSNYSIEIFNRWGEKMFESNSPQISWDGRTNSGVKVSDGTYYYIIKATAASGKSWDYHGFVQVIGSRQ